MNQNWQNPNARSVLKLKTQLADAIMTPTYNNNQQKGRSLFYFTSGVS